MLQLQAVLHHLNAGNPQSWVAAHRDKQCLAPTEVFGTHSSPEGTQL